MLNKVIIIGNLGSDPEIIKMKSGKFVSNFNIATTERKYNSTTNTNTNYTQWHKIVMFDRNITHIQNLKKGYMVLVEGRLQTRSWTDKKGVERSVTEVVVSTLKNLTHKTTQEYIECKKEQTLIDEGVMHIKEKFQKEN